MYQDTISPQKKLRTPSTPTHADILRGLVNFSGLLCAFVYPLGFLMGRFVVLYILRVLSVGSLTTNGECIRTTRKNNVMSDCVFHELIQGGNTVAPDIARLVVRTCLYRNKRKYSKETYPLFQG